MVADGEAYRATPTEVFTNDRWNLALELGRVESQMVPFFVLPTKEVVAHLRHTINKFCAGFEATRALCSAEYVSWECSQVMIMFLRCLRHAYGAGGLSREGGLWWDRRQYQGRTSEGMGFSKTLRQYGFCFLLDKLDWRTMRFRHCSAKNLSLFGTPALQKDYRRQWRGVKDAKNDYIRMEQLGAWLVEYRDCAEAYALIRSAMVALVVQVFRKDVFLRIIKEVRPEFEVDGRNGRLALSWDSLNECLMDSLKRPPRLVEGRRGHGKTASGLMEVLWGEDGQYNRGRWGEKMAYRQVYKVGQTHYVLAHDGRSEGRRSWRRAVERECIRTCWLLPYPQLSNDGRFMQRTSHQPGDPPSQLMWVGIGHGDVYDGLMEVVEEEQKAVISYSKIRQVFSRAGVVSANEMDMVTERGDCLSGWPESNEEVLSCSLGEMEDRLILIKSRQDCRRRDGRGELQRR